MPSDGRRAIYTANLYGGPTLHSESLTFAANDATEARRIAEDWAAVSTRTQHFRELDLYRAETLIYRRPLTHDSEPS